MRLIDMTIVDFIKEVDSNSPAPGGGSVSALASSIGIGLSRMMAHLSFGKNKFEANEEKIKTEFKNRFDKLESLRYELELLVDEDTNSFNEVMKAIRMPKESEKDLELRNEAMKKATIYSIEVPLKTSKLSLEALKHLSYLAQYGNQNAITDIAVGSLMLESGLEGAILNVKVNLAGLDDKELVEKYSLECEKILTEGRNIRDEFIESVHKKLEV